MKFGLALAPHHKVFGAFAIYSFTMGNIFPRFADLRNSMGVEEGLFGFGLINALVNSQVGLPSPAGNNSAIQNAKIDLAAIEAVYQPDGID